MKSANFGSATPCNIEAEAAVIAAMMSDARAIDIAADALSPADFFEGIYGRVFELTVREHSAGRSASPIALKAYLADDDGLRALGGVGHLIELAGSSFALIGLNDLAKQVAELARRRRLVDGLAAVVGEGCNLEIGNRELAEQADAAISETSLSATGIHQLSGDACFGELLDSFDHETNGVTCRTIASLDDLMGPLRPKQLVIVAARPGMGKTALALSYSIGAARGGHGVLFVSLEMSSAELAGRMASDMSYNGRNGVPYAAITSGRPSIDQIREIGKARDEMRDLPFQVVDTGKLTVGRLNMIVRRHARRFEARGEKLELVVVDYLQLLSPDHRMNSNYEAISEVSRSLKAIAKDNGVAIMALAQLSREVEKRADRRPQLSDLRDSGQIEQDADAVLFLRREEYYLKQIQPDEKAPEYPEWKRTFSDCENQLELILAKRRNGVTGSAMGFFFGAHQAVRGGA